MPHHHHNNNNNNNNHHSPFDAISFMDTSGLNPEGVTRLTVIASPTINQDQLWKLFDLIPGLDYCDLRKDQRKLPGQARGVATVVYNNSQSATYAKEKLHGFEYPPGQRLIVKFDSNHEYPPCPPPAMIGSPGGPPFAGMPRAMAPHNGNLGSPPGGPGIGVTAPQMPGGPRPNLQQDLAQLAETIAQATSLIQAAGLTPGQTGSGHMTNMTSQGNSINSGETYDPSYCSVKLPPPQPLAPVDSQVAERLFIVCHPTPPPIYAMKDVFGRFGNLIDIYILNGKTFGYAKYASKESADKAIQVLHGQEVLGSRLKVMEADPHDKSDSGRKRLRIDDQS